MVDIQLVTFSVVLELLAKALEVEMGPSALPHGTACEHILVLHGRALCCEPKHGVLHLIASGMTCS